MIERDYLTTLAIDCYEMMCRLHIKIQQTTHLLNINPPAKYEIITDPCFGEFCSNCWR